MMSDSEHSGQEPAASQELSSFQVELQTREDRGPMERQPAPLVDYHIF